MTTLDGGGALGGGGRGNGWCGPCGYRVTPSGYHRPRFLMTKMGIFPVFDTFWWNIMKFREKWWYAGQAPARVRGVTRCHTVTPGQTRCHTVPNTRSQQSKLRKSWNIKKFMKIVIKSCFRSSNGLIRSASSRLTCLWPVSEMQRHFRPINDRSAAWAIGQSWPIWIVLEKCPKSGFYETINKHCFWQFCTFLTWLWLVFNSFDTVSLVWQHLLHFRKQVRIIVSFGENKRLLSWFSWLLIKPLFVRSDWPASWLDTVLSLVY